MTGVPGEGSLLLVESRLRKFRKDFGVYRAPVDCFRLVRDMEESDLISLDWQETDALSSSFDAAAVWFPSVRSYLIISRRRPAGWKRYSAWRRCNFTMAHELGHIFCGHLYMPSAQKHPETAALEDLEADAFAARLLMPEEVLGQFRSVPEAAAALLVSESALRRRLQETGVSYAPRACPRCGFGGIPPSARYCRRCGEKLLPGPNPADAPEIAFLPPMPKICPVCGQRAHSVEPECLNCELPRRNRCVPEYDQPQHDAPGDALYCETCGAETIYKPWMN